MLKEDEILKFIQEDKVSTKKNLASIGQKYYDADHDIMHYRMFYFNADGKLVEDTTRSNVKISQVSSSTIERKTRYNCLLGIIFKIWKIQVEDAFVHS